MKLTQGAFAEHGRAINAALGAARAALQNEATTRERVERLEPAIQRHEELVHLHARLLNRGFWGRLRWLFLGR